MYSNYKILLLNKNPAKSELEHSTCNSKKAQLFSAKFQQTHFQRNP